MATSIIKQHWQSSDGFTLIELLVVLVIISIVVSFAVVTISISDNKRFQTYAAELKYTISLAEEEALLRSATLGLIVDTHSVQFFEYQEKNHRWQPMTETLLGKHSFPNDTEFCLKINGETIKPNTEPQLIIANGETTAFTLLIGKAHAAAYYQITGEDNGTLHSGLANE